MHSAPIGAYVFTNERRNHYKTTVYEDLCTRVPVDTGIAADKIKRRKGLQIREVRRFFQSIRWSWRRRGSKHKIGREAAKMGGLHFDSAGPNRRMQSQQETLQITLVPASSVMDRSSPTVLRGRPPSLEPLGISVVLRCAPAELPASSRPVIQRNPAAGWVGLNLPAPELDPSALLFRGREWTRILPESDSDQLECGTALAV